MVWTLARFQIRVSKFAFKQEVSQQFPPFIKGAFGIEILDIRSIALTILLLFVISLFRCSLFRYSFYYFVIRYFDSIAI